MSNEAPCISLSLSSKQDLAIIRWINLMKLERPRYASVYAREAIRHYINTQEYMVIGAVHISSDQVPEKTVLNILKDDMLRNLVNTVEKRSVSPLVRSILKKSILICGPGEEYIPDVIDILSNPIDFSSITEVIKPVETEKQPQEEQLHQHPQQTNNEHTSDTEVKHQQKVTPADEPIPIPQKPERPSSNISNSKKNILQTLGAKLE